MSISRNIVGSAARRLGLIPRPKPAHFIFDRAHAEETRRRDELAEYDEHLAVYGRHFASVPRNARPFSVLDVGCGTGQLVPISKAQLEYLLKFCRKGGTAILSILADKADTKGPAKHLFCPATDAQIRAAIADVQAVNCTLSEATFELPSIGVKETFYIISLIH